MPDFRRVGREAEDRAADLLLATGYTIVTRRFSSRHGEIDLIALDGDLLVFVEVKHRRAPGLVPEESIGAEKLERLQLAAKDYLIRIGEPERESRFDVIAIDRYGARHIKNAFC